MACTTQSAFVYVEKARSRLLGKLKNLSVILENLRQKEVFSDEAVSKIQAEKDDYDKTRKILDWVKCKGEDACYEFLRIVDMTRQRTLEVDLHHWISCFPFREDAQMDTNYLQGILKENSDCVTSLSFIFDLLILYNTLYVRVQVFICYLVLGHSR